MREVNNSADVRETAAVEDFVQALVQEVLIELTIVAQPRISEKRSFVTHPLLVFNLTALACVRSLKTVTRKCRKRNVYYFVQNRYIFWMTLFVIRRFQVTILEAILACYLLLSWGQ